MANDGSVEIQTPDDAAIPMEILCKVLHHRNDQVPPIESRLALQIALLADKSDCVTALMPSAHYWLEPCSPYSGEMKTVDRRRLLTAAYLFRDGSRFEHWAEELMLRSNEPMWPAEEVDCDVLRKVFGKQS